MDAVMGVWMLRIAWASLPVVAGPAAASALDDWSRAPQLLAAGMLWAAWATALAGLLAPRPAALTAIRVAAPAFLALAVVTAVAADVSVVAAVTALAATVVVTTLSGAPSLSVASANGVAYGDERRFPLRVPPGLLLGPLLLTPLLATAGAISGPLLIADARPVIGAIAVVLGWPVAGFLTRALHGLSRRWVVLVPAGLVLVDPLTLPDPVLFVRERITGIAEVDPTAQAEAGALDLRLGARAGSVALTLDRPTEFLYTRRGRRGAAPARSTTVLVACVGRRELLADAARRRIRMQ